MAAPTADLTRRRRRRLAAFAVLVGAVVGAHLLSVRALEDALARGDADAMPERVAVAYVRTIEPEAPPAVAPRPAAAPAAPRAPRAAREPAVAASAPAEEPAVPAPTPEPAAAPAAPAEPEPGEAPASAVADAASGAASAAASAPVLAAASAPAAGDAPPFVWPASTRVSYQLQGWYRGDVSGHAQVEWVNVGDGRYQVHLDIAAGPEFAPLVTRRMTSQGRLSAEGLAPERYDEDTQVLFRDARHVRVTFAPDAIELGNGKRLPRPAGVQDTASQFVQLTYLFSLEPDRLRAGASVEMPLALPRSLDTWTYDVRGRETLATPFGPIETFHLAPRRTSRPNGELTAEVWIAPELRHLPVRIRIRQSQENWADLTIARKPEIAAPPGATDARPEEPTRP